MVSAGKKAVAIGLGACLLVAAVLMLWGWVTIPEGNVGVQTERGAATGNVYDPGWHWQNPITQGYEEIETRPVTVDMIGEGDNIRVITEDGQDVWVDVTVRYTVDDPVEMFKEYHNHGQAQDRLIHPTVRSEMRHEASSIGAREIIEREGRMNLEQAALESLREDASGGVNIEAVQVRNVELNDEFSNELENIEIENAEAEQRVIEAEAEAEAERERAQGDADAMETRQEAITEEILALEQIEAYDSGTVYVTEGGTPVILDSESQDNGDGLSGSGLEEDGDDGLTGNESNNTTESMGVAP